ncbi:MAG: hypothetical protein FGF53_01885 [Candidatus Brockarchaeota archaeon]|nr:hypothetical protein [Candidatus Brockarchaeota archaeon]MBO3808641.1 hypothetical protein [Candidatus Brockarchaeota archaeon]
MGPSYSRETYQSIAEVLLRRLVHAYGLQAEEPLVLLLFRTLTGDCLGIESSEMLPPLSLICGDATPLQFCVSLSQDSQACRALRYVTEVCRPGMSLPARTALTRERIPTLLALVGAGRFQPLIDDVLGRLLPQSRLKPDYPMFGVWLGVQHQAGIPPKLKIYFNLLWELGDPWLMSQDAMRTLGMTDAGELIGKSRKNLHTQCRPAAIGFGLTADGFEGAKLYLRGYELSWSDVRSFLQKLGWTGFEQQFVRFHDLLMNRQYVYFPRSTVFSIDVPGKPGETYGVKLEIGPRFYLKEDRDVHQRIISLARELMLDILPYQQALSVLMNDSFSLEETRFHDVVGLGFTPSEGVRLNIYLKPCLRRYRKKLRPPYSIEPV